MFGNNEVKNFSDPVTGKRYLTFTLIMIVVLSFVVISNHSNDTLDSIASANL